MDSENRGEQAPTETEESRAPRTINLEAVDTEDGRHVVPAEGSVWQFYFPAGLTPTEDQFRVAVGALGAIKTMQAGGIAYTGWDASADGVTTDIVNFTGQSIIDAAVRADCIENARRADAFNERVLAEAERLAAERIVPIEIAANEQVQGFEQASIDADIRATAADGKRDALEASAFAMRAELDVFQRAAEVAKITPEAIKAARIELTEKSVLPDAEAPAIVEDVEGDLVAKIEFTETSVHREERKA